MLQATIEEPYASNLPSINKMQHDYTKWECLWVALEDPHSSLICAPIMEKSLQCIQWTYLQTIMVNASLILVDPL